MQEVFLHDCDDNNISSRPLHAHSVVICCHISPYQPIFFSRMIAYSLNFFAYRYTIIMRSVAWGISHSIFSPAYFCFSYLLDLSYHNKLSSALFFISVTIFRLISTLSQQMPSFSQLELNKRPGSSAFRLF